MSRHGGTRPRKTSGRRLKPVVLIVCEGAKTEPHYFRSFRVASMRVEVVGTGRSTTTLVAEAKRRAEEIRRELRDPPETWCVYDLDDFSANTFNAAAELCSSHGFGVAWSNPCFELWFLLHYQDLDASLHRSVVVEKLTAALGGEYEKNDPCMRDRLRDLEDEAIRRAEARDRTFLGIPPAKQSPHTLVFKLVRRLRELEG